MTGPDDVKAILSGLLHFGINPGLERVGAVLKALDHPERGPFTIQVVGTNGKGSTACLLESILRKAGYRTGRYTSPHLSDVRERITLSGEILPSAVFSELVQEVFGLSSSLSVELTFFELLTVVAFLAFSRSGCNAVVLEAGLGGRWDATTVCDPAVTLLTGVSLDHEEILGPGIERIFEEKVAVGRPGRTFVATLHDPVLRRAFLERARTVGFLPVLSGKDFFSRWERPESEGGERLLRYRGRWGERVFSPALTATYQSDNVAGAVAALEWSPLALSPGAMREGVHAATNPGRFETVSLSPVTILDGAHNPEAMERLLESLRDRFGPGVTIGWCLAFHADKDWRQMLKSIVGALPKPGALFFADLGEEGKGADRKALGRRSWTSPAEMERFVGGIEEAGGVPVVRGSLPALLDRVLDWARERDGRVVVVAGSLYLVGAVRPRFVAPSEGVLFSGNERDLPLTEGA